MKTKQSPPLHFFPGSTLLLSHDPASQVATERWGMWGRGSTHNSSLLPLLSPHTSPVPVCFSAWASASFKVCLPVSAQGPPWKYILYLSSLHRLRGISALAAGATPPPLSSLSLVSAGLSLILLPSLHTVMEWFLPFLGSVFPEVPPSLLRGSAVSCGGSA